MVGPTLSATSHRMLKLLRFKYFQLLKREHLHKSVDSQPLLSSLYLRGAIFTSKWLTWWYMLKINVYLWSEEVWCITILSDINRVPLCCFFQRHVNLCSLKIKRLIKRESRKRGETKKKGRRRTSLVVQWLRLRLAMPGTWVLSLVGHWDLTCHRAAKPAHHNSRVCALTKIPRAAREIWRSQINTY